MQATTAAAYFDQPSVEAFLSKVRRGLYPKPCRRHGSLAKWSRAALDQDLARRHGLALETAQPIEDIASLI